MSEGELKKKIRRIRFKKEGVGGPFVSIFDVFYKIDEAKKDLLKYSHEISVKWDGAKKLEVPYILIPKIELEKWFGGSDD